MSGDLDIIKAGLADRIESVCRQLLPRGRREGGKWVSNNPVTRDDKHTPALKVGLTQDPGAWKCWRSGDKGDVVGLVAYVLTGNQRNVKEALAWSRDFLGLRAMSREDREKIRREEKDRQAERDRKSEKLREKKLLEADRLFFGRAPNGRVGSVELPHGTLEISAKLPVADHARAYFAGRHVALEGVKHFNAKSMRVSPATEWWKGANWANEAGRRWKDAAGPLYPAVHSAMRSRIGVVTCCHVTFLDPVKPAKAPVTPAKLMWGEALGSIIELSAGPSGTAFWMADRDSVKPAPLIIAEGIETALAFAVEIPEARVWAGGSLAGVGAAPVDLDCVAWVLFARDNNDGNAQAQKQFDDAYARLDAKCSSTGKRLDVAASHVGDDFNDLARGEE